MKFKPSLKQGRLIKRYKRFLADIRLNDGSEMTLHCPNTGSMKNCQAPDSDIWYSISENPKRKYPGTWEIVRVNGGFLAGINTGRANALVREGIENATVKPLQGYDSIKAEVPYGQEKSRIDFLLEQAGSDEKCYVEVKNVTLGEDGRQDDSISAVARPGLGLFPDAVTERGRKHLRELLEMKKHHRAVLIFCVQHTGVNKVQPADSIDPEYGKALRAAVDAGVEVYAYRAAISAEEITLVDEIPVEYP